MNSKRVFCEVTGEGGTVKSRVATIGVGNTVKYMKDIYFNDFVFDSGVEYVLLIEILPKEGYELSIEEPVEGKTPAATAECTSGYAVPVFYLWNYFLTL